MTATSLDGRVQGGSPANILKHIAGASFPATRGDLLMVAKEKGAPPEVIDALERLPVDQFGGPQDILKAVEQE